MMTTHVLIGGTNDGRRMTFHGVQVQLAVLDSLLGNPVTDGSRDRPLRTEHYRLETIHTGGPNSVVLCLHSSLNVHDGLLRLLDGYNPAAEA